MVKEILLRVAAERPEVTRGKFAQALRRDLAFPREIRAPQNAFDPHINRKRREPPKAEEPKAEPPKEDA